MYNLDNDHDRDLFEALITAASDCLEAHDAMMPQECVDDEEGWLHYQTIQQREYTDAMNIAQEYLEERSTDVSDDLVNLLISFAGIRSAALYITQ